MTYGTETKWHATETNWDSRYPVTYTVERTLRTRHAVRPIRHGLPLPALRRMESTQLSRRLGKTLRTVRENLPLQGMGRHLSP